MVQDGANGPDRSLSMRSGVKFLATLSFDDENIDPDEISYTLVGRTVVIAHPSRAPRMLNLDDPTRGFLPIPQRRGP